jgi:predicted enzyme related to lactoylglutathione lyase
MGYAINHFEVNAKDAKKQQDFYGKAFGWKIDTNNPGGYGMADTGENGHGISAGIGTSPDGKTGTRVYIDTQDLEATLKKIEALGGKTVLAPMQQGPVTIALFADPEGNVVGLAKGM